MPHCEHDIRSKLLWFLSRRHWQESLLIEPRNSEAPPEKLQVRGLIHTLNDNTDIDVDFTNVTYSKNYVFGEPSTKDNLRCMSPAPADIISGTIVKIIETLTRGDYSGMHTLHRVVLLWCVAIFITVEHNDCLIWFCRPQNLGGFT